MESTIESLADMLKRNPDFKDVIGITQAKVPIVKFVHIQSDLEGDISLYNTLAQHNTSLLLTYASLDKRVKVRFRLIPLPLKHVDCEKVTYTLWNGYRPLDTQ